MGIHGLTTYVDTLPFGEGKVWESFDLRDTKVVIDGCGLYYHIYTSNRLNFKYGGQYNQLQKKLEEFFNKLWSNNVVPYVVIDGIMARDEKKFGTSIKRKTECIKRMRNLWTSKKLHHDELVLPRLVELTVVQVLQEINVPYVVADFEADCEIASLANELDAPVMASDSDFYIFNIKRGYIPFQQYNFSGTNTTVNKFSYDGFTKHLGIDPSMPPLVASLTGNDYISDGMLRPFTVHIEKLVSSSKLDVGSKRCKVPTIAQFLSKYNSVSKAIHAVIGLYSNEHKLAFEKLLHLSIEEYQMKQSNLIGYFYSDDLSCDVHTYNGHLLPQWVIKLYREGLIASEGLSSLCNRKLFLRTQCEDVSLPSAQICAQDLRWYYYALALHCEDAGTVVLVPSATELPSQNKASIACVVPDGEIELEMDSNHTLDTPPTPGPDNDHTFARKATPVAPSELQKQSKDSTPNMATGQAESQTESESSYYDISPPTSHTTQINNSEYSMVQSEFTNKLNFKETSTKSAEIVLPSSQSHSKADDIPHATSNVAQNIDTTEDTIVTEFDREGSTLVSRNVNLTKNVPDIEIQLHDIPKMSDQAKRNHLLSMLHSDLPFIHGLPIKHQLVASALRYWVTRANVKPAHLAALLVHYVGEKQSSSTNKTFQVSIEAVHGFSQWQNVLYWVERLNALFSYTFEQLQVTKLYNGVHVCMVYERLRVIGIKFAESIVTNANVYRHLYDVITKDLPRDCQFNQSRSSQRQQNKRGRKLEQGKQMAGGNPDFLKGNKFALLCALDSDED